MVYLDHAATTPMRQAAIDAWVEHAGAVNPGGQYASGRAAGAVLSQAREDIAELLGADPVEVVFTGSGTEADNIAVRGLYRARREEAGTNRVVASTIEHSAVLETVKSLGQTEGAELAWLEPDRGGHLRNLSALDTPAAVATMMWANNETGAVQPVREAAERAAAVGTPLHIDAVQAVGKEDVNFHDSGATTLAASAHKFGGPRGSGILLARRSPVPQPVLLGGGQERGLRPGTVDVAAAAATAAALREALAEREAENARVSQLRDELIERIVAAVPNTLVTTPEPRLPGHAHLMLPGAEAESMLMLLDSLGIEASAGSACSAGVHRLSHVLEAMGVPTEEGMGALRLTLGRTTTAADIDTVVAELPAVIERARLAGSL